MNYTERQSTFFGVELEENLIEELAEAGFHFNGWKIMCEHCKLEINPTYLPPCEDCVTFHMSRSRNCIFIEDYVDFTFLEELYPVPKDNLTEWFTKPKCSVYSAWKETLKSNYNLKDVAKSDSLPLYKTCNDYKLIWEKMFPNYPPKNKEYEEFFKNESFLN